MRPADFSVSCQGSTGPIPPPHYFEHTIRIGPGPEGALEMTAGYPGPGTPVWNERFPLGPEHLDWLYDALAGQGLFSQQWPARPDVPVGGGSLVLRAVANGQQFTLPPYLGPAQEPAAAAMRGAVRALLPPGLWETVNARREAYVHQAVPDDMPVQPTAHGALFTERQVSVGSFLATPLAGTIMMAINASRLRQAPPIGPILLGLVTTAVEIYLNLAIKASGNSSSSMLSLLLAVGAALAMGAIAKGAQGKQIAAHLQSGGARASGWAVFGLVIVAFVLLVVILMVLMTKLAG